MKGRRVPRGARGRIASTSSYTDRCFFKRRLYVNRGCCQQSSSYSSLLTRRISPTSSSSFLSSRVFFQRRSFFQQLSSPPAPSSVRTDISSESSSSAFFHTHVSPTSSSTSLQVLPSVSSSSPYAPSCSFSSSLHSPSPLFFSLSFSHLSSHRSCPFSPSPYRPPSSFLCEDPRPSLLARQNFGFSFSSLSSPRSSSSSSPSTSRDLFFPRDTASSRYQEGCDLFAEGVSRTLSAKGRRSVFRSLQATMKRRESRSGSDLKKTDLDPLHASPSSSLSTVERSSSSSYTPTQTTGRSERLEQELDRGGRKERRERFFSRVSGCCSSSISIPSEEESSSSSLLSHANSVHEQLRILEEQRRQIRRLKTRQVAALPRKHWLYIQAKKQEEQENRLSSSASSSYSPPPSFSSQVKDQQKVFPSRGLTLLSQRQERREKAEEEEERKDEEKEELERRELSSSSILLRQPSCISGREDRRRENSSLEGAKMEMTKRNERNSRIQLREMKEEKEEKKKEEEEEEKGQKEKKNAFLGSSIFAEDTGDIEAQITSWKRRKGIIREEDEEEGEEEGDRLPRRERGRRGGGRGEDEDSQKKKNVRWELPERMTKDEEADRREKKTSFHAINRSQTSLDNLIQLDQGYRTHVEEKKEREKKENLQKEKIDESSSPELLSPSADHRCFTWDWNEEEANANRKDSSGVRTPHGDAVHTPGSPQYTPERRVDREQKEEEGKKERRRDTLLAECLLGEKREEKEMSQVDEREKGRRGRKRRKEAKAEILANRQASILGLPPHWSTRNKVEPERFLKELSFLSSFSPSPSPSSSPSSAAPSLLQEEKEDPSSHLDHLQIPERGTRQETEKEEEEDRSQERRSTSPGFPHHQPISLGESLEKKTEREMIHLSTSHELLDNRDGQSKEESLKGEEERSPGNKILNEGEQEEDGFKRNREEGLEKHEALIVPSVLSSHQETCSSPVSHDLSSFDISSSSLSSLSSSSSAPKPYQSAMATSSSSSVVSSSPSSPRAAESDPSANSLILSPLSCSSSSSPHETSQAKMTKEEREGGDYLLDAGGELIRQLKKQALEYEATGVDPSLLEVLSSVALPYYPGIERQVRLKEMKSLAKMSFSDLLSLTMKSPSPEGQRGEAKNSVNPLLGEGSGISLCVKNCNALIKAKAHEGDLEGALEIYEKMIQHSLFPDEETFVHLIYGAGKKKDPAAARLLFLKMRSSFHTIEPTNRIYSSLIQAHVLSHDLSSAFALLRKMEDENLQPDCVIYTSLIDGLIKEKKIKKAWRLFWNLRTWKKIEPDEVLFTIMIKACALKGESERALNLLDDLRQSGLYPTDITYMEVIHACCDRKDFASKCFEFYHQMKAEDMPITLPVYSFLLRACVTTGNVKRAKNIVREMIERRIPLNSYIYSLLIRAFASAMRLPHVNDHERCANIRYAWYLLQDMRIKKIPIEVKTLNALLEVYIAGGFAQYAVDLLKYFPQFECEPDIYTYKALLT